MTKETETKSGVEELVAGAIALSTGIYEVMPPFIEGLPRDAEGRIWDVVEQMPRHRRVVNRVRDEFVLE